MASYVLIAIVRNRPMLPHSLHELPKILNLTLYETSPTKQLLTPPPQSPDDVQQLVHL